jgi:hypothetical protein
MKHKSTIVRETIAFSICNKSFKPLGIPKGQVKPREGLPAMIPKNIFFDTMLLIDKAFHTNTWFIHHEQI